MVHRLVTSLPGRGGLATAALLVATMTLGGVPAGGQTLQHDKKQPIEITADRLDVIQKERLATFSGNVDAVQGDLVLSADRLHVHYRGGADEVDPAATGSIRRIEAEGNVFLSSPRETAQGEVGVYDVARDLVTIEGSVVVTRDDNVIRGERLELDLTTGRSHIVAAVPSDAGGTPPQRVRAIFTPETAAAPGPPAGPAPAAGPAAPVAATTPLASALVAPRADQRSGDGAGGAAAAAPVPIPAFKPVGDG